MAGTLFKGGCQANSQRFVGIAKRFDGDNLRFAFSQRPGLIKDESIERAGALQRIGIAYQYPNSAARPTRR